MKENQFAELKIKLDSLLSILQDKKYKTTFFTSWMPQAPEGRFSATYKVLNGKNVYDHKQENFTRIWLFTFPYRREDFLIERTFRYLRNKKHNLTISVEIGDRFEFVECGADSPFWLLRIPSEFILSFKGVQLKTYIEQKAKHFLGSRTLNRIMENQKLVKLARILRYDEEFNEMQLNSIRRSFEVWVRTKDNRRSEKKFINLFSKFYDHKVENKPRSMKENLHIYYVEDARNFLFAWQSLSVIFPKMNYMIFSFNNSNNPSQKSCLTLFWRKKPSFRKNMRLYNSLYAIQEKFLSYNQKKYCIKQSDSVIDYGASLWLKMKGQFDNLWLIKVGQEYFSKFDPLMDLAGKLAFSHHEGKPLKFSFIIGSEQIWPVIAEIIDIDFHATHELKREKFDTEIHKKLCEANYSIFQIPNVVGFYNIYAQNLTKVVRLKELTDEESRTPEPVIDTDDIFCWVIKKIFTVTKEKAFIVCTDGNGRVLVYGLSPDNREDLLVIWDLRKSELTSPIPSGLEQELQHFFNNE